MANATQASTRYLCGACPDVGVTDGRTLAADDEVRCPRCGEVMTPFRAVECPRCLDWAADEDAELFTATHRCGRGSTGVGDPSMGSSPIAATEAGTRRESAR